MAVTKQFPSAEHGSHGGNGASPPRRDARARGLFPGHPVVWKAAAVVALIVAGLLVWQVALVKRDWFTGTNSVYGRSPSVAITPGQRLCLHRLDIPAGTGRVRFDAQPAGPPVNLRLDVQSGGSSSTGRTTLTGPNRRFVEIPADEMPIRGESAPGSLCLTASGAGAVTLFGVWELRSDDVSPTLDGQPTGHPVAVWYMPPPGERRSWAAGLGDMAKHAATFRPGFVGAWTYLGLVIVLLPALAYAAVRLLALAAAGIRTRVPLVLAIGLLGFAYAAAWSVITPPFDAPDEYEHYAYGQYLAETGNAPCQTCAKQTRSTEEILAVDGARIGSYLESPDGRPPWLKSNVRAWEARDRLFHPRSDDGGGVTTASSHSPPYYALTAPFYGIAKATGGSVFDRLFAMRFASAILAGLTAALAALIVLELLPGRRFPAAVAGLLVAFQPMFGFIGGALNNDNGVNAVLALIVLLLVRALRRGLTPGLGAGIAAALAAAPLFKLTGYAAYPPTLLALAILLWRQHSREDLPAWAALIGTFVAVEVAWSLLSPTFGRTVYATPDGGAPGSQPTVAGARSDPLGFASYVWQVFLPRLPFMADLHVQRWPAYDIYIERGFGAFGWYAIKFPTWVYLTILGGIAAVTALAARATWIEWGAVRARLPQILVMLSLVVTVILGVHASFFTTVGGRATVAEQGRYAFPAITVFASIAVAATFGLGRRASVAVGTVLVVAMVALGVAGQLLALERFFS